ncbi:MAG: urate hydroxylase PuuD [Pseudomonadota bacterium]|nr:urate hydroxylase PuuD [Pseudomonadota bacterium]
MSGYWLDWLNFLLRFVHVITAIAWIGASFYFIWLDNSLEQPPKWKQEKGISGDLWAIHGGGFYEVAKYKLNPEAMPQYLHWFKWEAYSTWISGFLLLSLMYFFGASTYLIDPQKVAFAPWQAISIALFSLIASWLVYDRLCKSPIAQTPPILAAILVLCIGAEAYFFQHIFSDRAAYLLVGASIATCMAFSVWRVIMPSQTALVAAVRFGKTPDPGYAQAARLRSVHNNYATLPVIFLMISNHYPITYTHPQAWLLLVCLVLLGMWVRHFFNLRHRGQVRPKILISGAVLFLLIAWWFKPVPPNPIPPVTPTSAAQAQPLAETAPTGLMLPTEVTTAVPPRAVAILHERCATCHSATPTDAMFNVAPAGVMLDTEAQMKQWAERIRANAVLSQNMPFMNKTQMTDAERQQVGAWLDGL